MWLTLLLTLAQPPADPFAKWEKEVSGLEKKIADTKPAKGGIVFAGSSTIRLWDTVKAFPDWKAVNAGFGGSQIREVTHFAERLVLIHEPKTIFFYAGDNDINANRTPEQVRDDFKAFAAKVHGKLPKCVIYFLPIKPSVKRWEQYEKQTKANGYVKEMTKSEERIKYVDLVPKMLGQDGKPPADLFVQDGLHMSPKGYEIWNEELKKILKK